MKGGLKGCCGAVLLLCALGCAGETIPDSRGTLLSGQEMRLPRDLPARQTVLVVGFTRKSGKSCEEWRRVLAEMGVARLQVPMLESVPKLIRGMVLSGMKKGTPAEAQGALLPLFEKEAEWKRVTGFSAADDAYVLLVDEHGEIVDRKSVV